MSEYYIGLDVGTNSVGWAATDTAYSLLKYKGNAMWGVRLFDDANDAAERRSSRTARRLHARSKQRLALLELLFSEALAEKDPLFLTRLAESALQEQDRSSASCRYALFNDSDFTDREYFKQYPTAYHLRSELIHSTAPHDIRLVYLALHHIVKSRGHFLFDMDADGEYKGVREIFDELCVLLEEQYDTACPVSDTDAFLELLQNDSMGITAKKKALKPLVGKNAADMVDGYVLCCALVGATVKCADLFCDETLKDADIPSLRLRDDLDENYDRLADALSDRMDLVVAMKAVFDAALLSKILGKAALTGDGTVYISDAKVQQFDENRADLALLKRYVRSACPEKYGYIFRKKKDKLNNFAAYGKRSIASGEYTCKQEDFCKFLKKELPAPSDAAYAALFAKIENGTLLPKLKGADNSVIPHQLHYRELKKILENAAGYLPFLQQADADGLTVTDKILSIFSFRIPYYVGPLNPKSPNAWVVRTEEKITPWNFEKVVDTQKSAEGFMIRLIGKCTYTGEAVLPKDSLLYSEFAVLNEINPLCLNGTPLPTDIKNRLFQDLFVQSNARVTKKKIKQWLLMHGLAKETDEVSGVDNIIKANLKSYHDFKNILCKVPHAEIVEDIIKHILIFGEDKKMLRRWLKASCPFLDEQDTAYVLRLRYKDWGRLSRTFLTEIYTPDENGEALSVMDMLRATNKNLQQLLTDDYDFAKQAEEYRSLKFGVGGSLDEQLQDLYISPRIHRSIRQTLKIVKEITAAEKCAPKKIFLEVARGTKEDLKGKRTVSRKDNLLQLYKACKEEHSELAAALAAEDEGRLRSDALYLYYTQFGKCMYSGESIDITKLKSDYDIDHIFPQSRVKDDSLDNRVLVKRELNNDKKNIYPISADIRSKMQPFWHMLKEKGLISPRKYERLVRNTPLTEAELSAFVSRQLVENRQSTKALATVLKRYYPDTKLVYSKAMNVSDFRHEQELVKCRDINDLHHAKDAYLNIVVGNVYDTKFTAAFFKNILTEEYSLNKVFERDVRGAWKKERDLAKVRSVMKKNNILVTRMPHENKGKLFDLQILPKGKGQLPVKVGRSIENYGGYNNVSGAYSIVVEHDGKKGRVRTIEPVYIYQKALYEQDPLRYCREILGLSEPEIIADRILFDTLLELNGKRIYITGRSGNQLCGKHPYQLAIDSDSEKAIKDIKKYVDRCAEKKAVLPITEHDGISAKTNLRLFDLFIAKFHAPVYAAYFTNLCNFCEQHREDFIALTPDAQCRLLLEILKAFKCDRTSSDLSALGGPKNAGILMMSKTISTCRTAYVIHHSPSGLYETKVDLLRP